MGKPDYKAMAALYKKAHDAGMAAGTAAKPIPMHVVQRANPFDDKSPIVKRSTQRRAPLSAWRFLRSRADEPVMDGVCGFAWIKIKPARGPFVAYLKSINAGHKAYDGGYDVWVSEFNQSMTRKEDYAHAFAKVLEEVGIKAYAQSRMD